MPDVDGVLPERLVHDRNQIAQFLWATHKRFGVSQPVGQIPHLILPPEFGDIVLAGPE